MKFSDATLSLLKNFVTINSGIAFKKGNLLRTMSPQKNILAQATIEEEIPGDFCIHDLTTFLSVLSLHKDTPELSFDEKHVFITGNKGRSKIAYRCAEENTITLPPTKNLVVPTEDVKFTLTEDDFNWIMKSSAVLQCPHIAVVAESDRLHIKTMNAQDNSAHTDSLDLCPLPEGTSPTCRFLFKAENWKMIPGPYEIIISKQGISSFTHTTRKLQYWIAIEMGSK